MPYWFLAPAVLALFAGLVGGLLYGSARPACAVKTLTVLALVAAATALAALGGLAFGYAINIGWFAEVLRRCPPLHLNHPFISPALGLLSAGLVGAAGIRVARCWWGHYQQRTARRRRRDPGGVHILPTDEPIAYAEPGKTGWVVVSTGMLQGLTADEQRVLIAHEAAHIRLRHGRYLLLGEFATVAVPLLRPLRLALAYSVERWADESVASEIGDRWLVARTIAKAALVQHDSGQPSMAFARWGVTARVHALTRVGSSLFDRVVGGVLRTSCFVAVIVTGALQLHHLAEEVLHACRLA